LVFVLFLFISFNPGGVMKVLQGVFAAYGLSVMMAAVWFEYLFAREHGFWSWLTAGAVVPVLKAVVWPVFMVW
jgi:hypothetical protein